MTTAQGRAFATMLAVFAEMEAAAISARVTAARRAIIQTGRRAGGRPPFGWRNIKNPDGPGMVLAKDPGAIGVVEELARRAMAGESLYGLTRWLEAGGIAPRTREGRKDGNLWHEAIVESLLRNPVLAGMTPYTPGRKPLRRKTEADDTPEGREAWKREREAAFRIDVLRDAEGLPIVDESVAILTPAERRTLLAALDAAKRPGSRQKAGAEPALLYGLARCGTCGGLMYRAMAASKYRQYRCQQRNCARQVGISRDALEDYVTSEFLRRFGRFTVVEVEEIEAPDPAPKLADIEAAIAETVARMADDDADVEALADRLANLKAARSRAKGRGDRRPARPVLRDRGDLRRGLGAPRRRGPPGPASVGPGRRRGGPRGRPGPGVRPVPGVPRLAAVGPPDGPSTSHAPTLHCERPGGCVSAGQRASAGSYNLGLLLRRVVQ